MISFCATYRNHAHCGNYIVEVTMPLSSHDLLAAMNIAMTHDQQVHPMTI